MTDDETTPQKLRDSFPKSVIYDRATQQALTPTKDR